MPELAVFLLVVGLASFAMIAAGAMIIVRALAPFDPPIAPARAGRPVRLSPRLRAPRVVLGAIAIVLGAITGLVTLRWLAALPPHVALSVLFTLVAVPVAIARRRGAHIKIHAT